MKKIALSIVLSNALFFGYNNVTNAGIPVIDAGSIAQAVQQLVQLQQQYQLLEQQYSTMENQYKTLKNNISSFNLSNASQITNSMNQIDELKKLVSSTSQLDGKTSSSTIKSQAGRLNALYKTQVDESNQRIKRNLDIVEALKAQLAGANVADSAKLQTAINDAYAQINNEKTIQAGLSASARTGSNFLSKKYASQKLYENSKKSSIWQ